MTAIWRNPLLVAHMLIQPFAGKGRRREGEADGNEARESQDFVARRDGGHCISLLLTEHRRPHKPQNDHVRENGKALDPADPLE